MYIVLGGYLQILGVHNVKSCGTLSISASYRVFVYGIYRKSRLVCVCVVVGPVFISTSPAFIWSSASHPAGPQSRLVQKR